MKREIITAHSRASGQQNQTIEANANEKKSTAITGTGSDVSAVKGGEIGAEVAG